MFVCFSTAGWNATERHHHRDRSATGEESHARRLWPRDLQFFRRHRHVSDLGRLRVQNKGLSRLGQTRNRIVPRSRVLIITLT